MSVSTDTVQHWLQQAGRHPLLNKGQEVQLSRDIHAWLDCEHPSPQVARRGKRAKDKLFKCNLRLVATIAKKYQSRIRSRAGLSFEDLLQEGCLGLNRACEKFDHERGFAFSTFSYWWIRQSMGRYIEMNQSTIKISTQASQIAMRWRYRPEGMTIEEFSEKEGRPVKNCQEYIDNARQAESISLDAHLTGIGDEEASSLLDFVASNDAELEESDWIEAVQGLNEIDEIRDAVALVDLSMTTKPAEMAEFLECSTPAASKKVRDAKSVIREHAPSHIRERICGIERKVSVKLEVQKPVLQPHVARELVLAGCKSNSESMPEVSTNGHHQSLEAEAMAVIETVKAEPEAKPTRKRRSREEVAAEKATAAVALKINGMEWEGAPADIAAVMKALND